MTAAGPRVECLRCGDVLQSQHTHDFVTCRCGAVSVDGGASYTKISGNAGDFVVRDGVLP